MLILAFIDLFFNRNFYCSVGSLNLSTVMHQKSITFRARGQLANCAQASNHVQCVQASRNELAEKRNMAMGCFLKVLHTSLGPVRSKISLFLKCCAPSL